MHEAIQGVSNIGDGEIVSPSGNRMFGGEDRIKGVRRYDTVRKSQ